MSVDHCKVLQVTPPDAEQPTTSDAPDIPDAEELIDTTQAPSTMVQDLSGW